MGGKRLRGKKTLTEGSTARVVLRRWGGTQHIATVKPKGQRKKAIYSDVTCRKVDLRNGVTAPRPALCLCFVCSVLCLAFFWDLAKIGMAPHLGEVWKQAKPTPKPGNGKKRYDLALRIPGGDMVRPRFSSCVVNLCSSVLGPGGWLASLNRGTGATCQVREEVPQLVCGPLGTDGFPGRTRLGSRRWFDCVPTTGIQA